MRGHTDTQERLRLLAVSAYETVYPNRQQPTYCYRVRARLAKAAALQGRGETRKAIRASALNRILA